MKIKSSYTIIAVLILLVYLLPNIFFLEKAKFLVHDNMNSNVVWYKTMAESGKYFGKNSDIVPNSLSGIPRGCYPSELNIIPLMYFLFKPLIAYNLNIILIHLIAFLGMYAISKRYFLKRDGEMYAAGISLVFASLPFWPSGGLSVAGQPLLLYAFLNIYYRDYNWKNWLILILVPLYSELVLSNLFLIPVLGFMYLLAIIKTKRISGHIVLAFVIFILASIISEHRLFEMQFVEHFQNHRDIQVKEAGLNIFGLIGISVQHFLKSQYHFYSVNMAVILILAIASFYVLKFQKNSFILAGLILFMFCISLIYVFPYYKSAKFFLIQIKFLEGVQLRFYSLFPILSICIYALILSTLASQKEKIYKSAAKISILILTTMNFLSVGFKDYQKCYYAENSFYHTFINNPDNEFHSFKDYYNSELFKRIKKEINADSCRVACLGLSPEILQYSGFHTVDGYFNYYSKEYKDWFKSVCEKEMIKSKVTSLGNHCELISSELLEGKEKISNLEIDFDKLKQKRTKFLFSIKKINSEYLSFAHLYTYSGSPLYVYKLK